MAELTSDLLSREKPVREYIEEYSELFDVDPNLVRGLITQECLFKGDAVSPTGAYGFGQFTSIGAAQVRNIAEMTSFAADLKNFQKEEASDPDRGIKAICATLWWLFYRKYKGVEDKKVQVETVLTFYNSGGRPAALVIKHGGHSNALKAINVLPANQRSQADHYAPGVLAWFVKWHDHFADNPPIKEEKDVVGVDPRAEGNPFVTLNKEGVFVSFGEKHKALVEALLLLGQSDQDVLVSKNSAGNMTEIRLIFKGKY